MKTDGNYLLHIRDSILEIEDISYNKFLENRLIQDGVIRELEIIGEASNRLSSKVTEKYKKVPWRDIIDMRHKLIHGYFGVDLGIVWKTVKKDIPNLKKEIESILKEF